MKLICYTVAIVLAAGLLAGKPGLAEDDIFTRDNLYPRIVDILSGPVRWFSDSELGPEPWQEDHQIGYHFRLLLCHDEYGLSLWAERIDIYGDEGLLRAVNASYIIRDMDIGEPFDAHCGSVRWLSPQTLTIEVNPEQCYQLDLGETQAELRTIECK